jgi:ABC-type dipeptide/oligopeptide/nickel transport system permease subunit
MKYKTLITPMLAAVLALSGCGADSEEETASTAAAEQRNSSTEEPTNQGVSAAVVEFDGVVYRISCTAVSPSSLSDPLDTLQYGGRDIAARLLAGVNVSNAIAIEVPGGACTAGDRQLSDWSLAIADGVDDAEAAQIACDSGLKVPDC